jgi:hypothetical protein
VSQTDNTHAERSTHRRLDRRTVSRIQGKVAKQNKRNALHRFVLSKTDKDKVAAWKQDFVRVLRVFNVRTTDSLGHSSANSIASFQTELAIDTNMAVSNTQAMVADIHQNMLTEREGASGKNRSVGKTCYPLTTEYLPFPRLEPG